VKNNTVDFNYTWIVSSAIIFLLLSLFLVGPEYRRILDFESDITLVRFLKGDFFALIISNRSPVVQYSIPYGGWPPLHILMQATWLFLNISIPYSRLLTGILSILLFGFTAVILTKRISILADLPLVFMTAILSPASVIYTSLGVRHILIPIAAIVPLLLLTNYLRSNNKNLFLVFFTGFLLGLTDWNAYSIIPAVFLLLLFSSVIKNLLGDIDIRSLYRFSFYLAGGFLLSFALFKLLLLYDIHREFYKLLYTMDGITLNKFFLRLMRSPISFAFAIGLSCIRMFWIFLPVLGLIFLIRITKSGSFVVPFNSSFERLILILSFISPIIYCLIFSGHVSVGDHVYQTLAFLTPASILVGLSIVLNKNKNLIRFLFLSLLLMLNILNLRGQELIPDRFLTFNYGYKLDVPLRPGNYELHNNLNKEVIKISLADIVRVGIKQISQLPLHDKRLIALNAYPRAVTNFEKYGSHIKQVIPEDEISFIFGYSDISFMYFTDRVILGVTNMQELNDWLVKLNKKMGKSEFGIIVPDFSSYVRLSCNNIINKNTIRVNWIRGTPYYFIQFKLQV
jgi:hypothetical protein